MDAQKFTQMFLNDITRNEDKNHKIADAEERIRYNEIMAGICALGAVCCLYIPGVGLIGTGILGLIAARKMHIVGGKRGRW